MISFHNQKFHEKIVKKYGRIIRKSYFPNLFFKQDFRSSGQRKIHVFFSIKFDFHNTLLCKSFLLNSSKEKQYGSSVFPLKLNIFSSKPYEPTNEKSACLNVEPGKHESLNLVARLISLELPPCNFIFSGQVTPEFALIKLERITLINKILTACNLQLSNLITLDPTILKIAYPHCSLANSTFSDLKLLKLKFFGNYGRVPISKIRNGTQVLPKHNNFYSEEYRLFFERSRLSVINKIGFQKVESAADSPIHHSIHVPGASSLSQKINSEAPENSNLEKSREVIREKQDPVKRKKKQAQRREKQVHIELFNSIFLESITEKLKQKDSFQIQKNRVEMPFLPDLINTSWALPGNSVILDTSFFSPVHFRILNFLEKNVHFLYREYSVSPESTEMGLSIINGQETGEFRYSKKGKLQPLSPDKMFSGKKEIAGKKTPERLSKNLLIFKKVFLQGDMPGFPEFYSRPALRLFTLIGSPLSFSKNENLNTVAENHESASTLWDHNSKKFSGYSRSEKIFTTYFTNAFQQYPETKNEIRAGVYEKILIPTIEKRTENLQSVLMQFVLKLNSLRNTETKSSGHTVTHALNWLTAFTKNTVTVSQFNRYVSHTLSSTILQLNQQVSHTSGSIKILQLNKQEIHKPESTISAPYFDVVIKPASRTLISVFKSLGILLTGNKLTHRTETYSIDSLENIVPKNNYHYLHILLLKAFKLPKISISFGTATIEAGNPAHLRKIPAVLEYNNTATHTPEQLAVQVPGFITARIFKKLMTLKPDMIKEYIFNYKEVYSAGIEKAYSHLYFASRAFNYAGIRTFSEIYRSLKVPKATGKVAPSTYYSRTGYHLSGPYAAENYIADMQNVDNIRELRELKRRRHYSVAGSTLQSTISQPVFLKSPETSTYGPRRAEALLYSSKQSFISNKTAAPVPGLHEAYTFNSQQNPSLYFTSAYTGVHPATGEFNYPAIHTQNYPAVPFYHEIFSPLNSCINQLLNLKTETINHLVINSYIQKKTRKFSAILNNDHLEKRDGLALSSLLLLSPRKRTTTLLPKNDILKYFKTIFLPSEINTPAATEYFTTLSKTQNPIMGSKLSSNGFFPGRFFDSSVTLLSGTAGTASGKKVVPLCLSKFASFIISQDPVFARKYGVPSNIEIGILNTGSLEQNITSFSYLNERQRPDEQKVPHPNTARMKLCCRGGKKENSSMGNFLLRNLLNFPGEKSNQQVNINMHTPAELYTVQGISSGFVLLARPDLTLGTKWKKASSTLVPKKKSEERKDMFGRFLLEFKSFRSSDNIAKSRPYFGSQSTNFVFLRTGGTGKTSSVVAFGAFGKESSELMHEMEGMHKTGTEELVYGTSQNLQEGIEKIEKVAFETKEAVANHLESHLQQTAGNAGQIKDIEYISEKVMQMINKRLKIEVERRGIF